MLSDSKRVLLDQRPVMERSLRAELDAAAVLYRQARQKYEAVLESRAQIGSGVTNSASHDLQVAERDERQARACYVAVLKAFSDFVLLGKTSENAHPSVSGRTELVGWHLEPASATPDESCSKRQLDRNVEGHRANGSARRQV